MYVFIEFSPLVSFSEDQYQGDLHRRAFQRISSLLVFAIFHWEQKFKDLQISRIYLFQCRNLAVNLNHCIELMCFSGHGIYSFALQHRRLCLFQLSSAGRTWAFVSFCSKSNFSPLCETFYEGDTSAILQELSLLSNLSPA